MPVFESSSASPSFLPRPQRHGRHAPAHPTGLLIPPQTTRNSSFIFTIAKTVDYALKQFPEKLTHVQFFISTMPSSVTDAVPLYHCDLVTRAITFYRLPLQRFLLNQALEPLRQRLLEQIVLSAINDFLENTSGESSF